MRSYPPCSYRRAAFAALSALVCLTASLSAAAGVAPSQPGAGGAAAVRAPLHAAAAAMVGDVRNVTASTDWATIQDAIDNATAGDVIEVVATDHSEGPQIVVDRNLTLRGATGSEVVRPTSDTGSSGDARGWFLVNAGVDLTVRDLTFDGSGFLVYQGFRHRGTGAFEDCAFRNIRYNESGPTYAGTAIVAFGGAVDVRRCSFAGIGRIGVLFFGAGVSGSTAEDNVYTGKGSGDFLDYGFEAGAGAGVTLARNVVSGNRGVASSDGSTSAALLVTTFFGAGTQATVEGNQLLDNTTGIAAGYDAGDTATVAAAFNRIVGNDFGIVATSASVTTQAENDWWGCNGGPGAAGCDPVSGMADFDPWLVLRLPAPAGNASPLDLAADLTENSDAVDVSGLGSFPDGVGVAFTTSSGSVSPPLANTSNGTATTTLTAGAGPATVTATLDNQAVMLLLDLDSPLAVPTLSPFAFALLLVLLALAGLAALRRGREGMRQ